MIQRRKISVELTELVTAIKDDNVALLNVWLKYQSHCHIMERKDSTYPLMILKVHMKFR